MRKFEPPPPSPLARLAEMQEDAIQAKRWGGAVEVKAEPPAAEIPPPPWLGVEPSGADEATLEAEPEPLPRAQLPKPPWADEQDEHAQEDDSR